MPLLILAVLIAVPLVEVGLFIEVGGAIGLWPTIILAVVTAIAGIWLVRIQGFLLLMQVRAQIARGEVPTKEIFDGICLAIAGVMLFIPGFATDSIGILLLLPPVRSFLFKRSKLRAARMRANIYNRNRSGPGASSRTIEGEWQELGQHEELPPDRRPPGDQP